MVRSAGEPAVDLRGRPAVAAKILGAVRDVGRFPTAAAFASYCGAAPIPASSFKKLGELVELFEAV